MNPELRHKCLLPTVNNSRLHLLVNQSLKWQHQLCQNPNSDPDITSILVDHSCRPQNAAQGQVHVANEFSSIRRSGGLQLVDGSVSLMNVEAQAEQMALVASTSGSMRREHTESLSLTVVPKKPRTPRIRDSRVLEYSRPLNPAFKDVKTFIDFKIIYGGLCIDNELSEDLRSTTIGYAFRRSNFFMMARLPEGLCPKLVAGMIGETVSIAAKIKNTKLTTAKEELKTWDSILKAFELLGMKVGFLRDRKHLLATFLFESEAEPDWNVLKARYQKWKKNNFTLKFIIKENVNIRGYPNQTVFNIQALFYLADLDALVAGFNWIVPLALLVVMLNTVFMRCLSTLSNAGFDG
ncbi:B3 DNA binding domain-containing protein [Artemisia annua]|uniref:B3 DNA binding domain-containing protein n=1 Tax=Artemisia annua TaxID=35608 RepID=A0A2U1ME51_ARTAN|nr:B3 DNA binding domain-containing protein [Artemisia annua]